jgi:spoIIIJ-associated protein
MEIMSDRPKERSQQWLTQLLQLAACPTEVQVEEKSDCYWLTIDRGNLTPEQIEILIGTNGSTIDSIQYLANTILNLGQTPEGQAAYTIELDNYRFHRLEQLQAIAQDAVDRVRQTGEEFEISSLSSAERRQLHTLLKEYDDLDTYSHGQEPDRRLVVRPK